METKIQNFFSWEFYDHPPREKSKLWYIFAFILLLTAAIYGITQDAWTFSVAVLVFAGVYAVFHHKKPKRLAVAILENGIKIENQLMEFKDIKAFWINEIPDTSRILYLRMHKKLSPDLAISVENTNISELKEFLSAKIPEFKKKGEDLSIILGRLLKI